MKRRNEFLVGLVVLLGLAVIVGGALWLSESDVGRRESIHTARFRTVGGLGPGAPVTLRGVRVGRVEAIRLADGDWVEADLRIFQGVDLPPKPAVIAASASLFGEWVATIIPFDQAPSDPNLQQMLLESARDAGGAWPGVTLPDIGQLTAQASRIAGDVAAVTARIQNTFDTVTVRQLRESIKDFRQIASILVQFTQSETNRLSQVTGNVATSSDAITAASSDLRRTLARVDSATSDGQLQAILNDSRGTTAELRRASTDLAGLMASARAHEASLVNVLLAADSIMRRMQQGQGTLGLLSQDSTLYRETTATMTELRALIADIRVNPRKYFKFSVF